MYDKDITINTTVVGVINSLPIEDHIKLLLINSKVEKVIDFKNTKMVADYVSFLRNFLPKSLHLLFIIYNSNNSRIAENVEKVRKSMSDVSIFTLSSNKIKDDEMIIAFK
ncbi:MAG: DUF4898 domain-containing protein [Sulfolobaceae archaeon]|nr:DUF4898 domain-containing protein [Sulfolobaceae archaeon]